MFSHNNTHLCTVGELLRNEKTTFQKMYAKTHIWGMTKRT